MSLAETFDLLMPHEREPALLRLQAAAELRGKRAAFEEMAQWCAAEASRRASAECAVQLAVSEAVGLDACGVECLRRARELG